MDRTSIIIKGAKTHNLKNIDLEIPKNRIVVFCGKSGSGKSSLVFDTIHTEAQRQLIETFSSFARRRLPKLSRPDIDEIRNIGTSIVIDQKRMGRTLRSTVGTATEINTYLRMLFSRCGEYPEGQAMLASFAFSFNHPEGMCRACSGLGKRIRVNTELLIDKTKSIKEGAITHPDFKTGSWYWREIMNSGLFDTGKILSEWTEAELYKLLYAEAVPVERKEHSLSYLKNFEGLCVKLERLYVNKAEDELPDAKKSAYDLYFSYSDCDICGGTRLNDRARSVKVGTKSISELCALELTELDRFLEFFDRPEYPVARTLVVKIRRIISHLTGIGVGYLSLERSVSTLSGGESQRVKMARQLDCDLVDLMYILDEPTTGLHPRDGQKLETILKELRDKGNSVLVVEHDPDIIRFADWVVDVGPGAGIHGGTILFSGTPEKLLESDSVTGRALRKDAEPISGRFSRRKWTDAYRVEKASLHNLKNISVLIPKGVFTCITGVAGSGKSTLVDVFLEEHPEAVVIDQQGIFGNSRSNPASYIGIFDLIRKEMAAHTGAKAGLFSFNSDGACPKCNGSGTLSVEMNFLDDVKMVCDECEGKRYNETALSILYQGKNIAEILAMTADEAADFFRNREIKKRLKVLAEVGLDYIGIGQSLSSLSGGECQRLKLATELHKEGGLYVMDEPTSGLHLDDIDKLLLIVSRLVGGGNTVIAIEHNLSFIRSADWLIDMGPEGGSKGGKILAEGIPEDVAKNEGSVTGKYLGIS